MKDDIYVHYHPDEHPFVDRVLDWLRSVSERHSFRLTDFLDPRQCEIVFALSRSYDDTHVTFYGGYDQAERRRAAIAPSYRELEDDDLDVTLMEIRSADSRFSELDHKDMLGALTGLGIKRDKIGDIHLHPEFCHVLLCGDMSEYVRLHLHQVHRLAVSTEVLALDQLQVVETQLEQTTLTVSSMRLDAIVSELARTSRAKSLPLIRSGRCKVNWRLEEDPSSTLNEGDILSIRGYGRFKVIALEGTTKKGNLRVKIGQFV